MEKYIKLINGDTIPKLGMGTWFLGEKRKTREQEIDALQAGLKAGVALIDTAEMYGNGKSEQLIGEATKPFNREKLYLVSKVYPHNAGRGKISESLEQTLNCPLAQGGNLRKEMQRNPILLKLAEKHGITLMQLLLAFVLQNEHMTAIPRSGKKEHVLENAAVQEVTLSEEDLEALNKAYPVPGTKMPLDIV